MNEAEIKQRIFQLSNLINTHKGVGSPPTSSTVNIPSYTPPKTYKPPNTQYYNKSPARIPPKPVFNSTNSNKPTHSSVTYVNNIPVTPPKTNPIKLIMSPQPIKSIIPTQPITSPKVTKIPKTKTIPPQYPYAIKTTRFSSTSRFGSSMNLKKKFLSSKMPQSTTLLKMKLLNKSTSPTSIDSIFIKKGNSLVRTPLDEKYILNGNKLVRDTSNTTTSPSNNTSTPSTISTPSPVKTPIKLLKIKKTPSPRNGQITSTFLDRIREKLSGTPSGNTKSKKKKIEYCLFFNRFGKCNNGDTCKYTHDQEKVRTCPKFLSNGSCNDDSCTLKHKMTDIEKMPVCSHFLKGHCVVENCPYLHVNVSQSAEVCKDFLRGNCPHGSNCKLKHTYSKSNNNNNNGDDIKNNNNNKDNSGFGFDENLFN